MAPAFTFQSSKILTATASSLGPRMGACKWAWRLESLEGKDKTNASYHDIPSPHLEDEILSKALDLWMCGGGELRQLMTTQSVPLSSLRHFHCTLLARQKRQESRDTPAFSSFSTQPHRNLMPTRSIYGLKQADG